MRILTRFPISKRRAAVVVAATAAATALALGLVGAVWSDNGGIGFQNIPASVLISTGLTLQPPQSTAPMTEATASAIATKAGGGQAVLGAQYAHCVVPGKVPPVDQDCWAFSLDPNGLTSTTGVPATWFVVLVDPATGNVLLSRFGN